MNEKMKNILPDKWELFGILIGVMAIIICLWPVNRPGMPNSSATENRIVIKDSVETKKLRAIVDSVIKENKRLDAIINRKQSHTSQTLKQNEINKSITPEFTDTIAYHFNDSVRARYKERYYKGDYYLAPYDDEIKVPNAPGSRH
jgi:hypothetical protein